MSSLDFSIGIECGLTSFMLLFERERTNRYLKDRIEEFDDYYPCTKDGCELGHVKNWLSLFVDMH